MIDGWGYVCKRFSLWRPGIDHSTKCRSVSKLCSGGNFTWSTNKLHFKPAISETTSAFWPSTDFTGSTKYDNDIRIEDLRGYLDPASGFKTHRIILTFHGWYLSCTWTAGTRKRRLISWVKLAILAKGPLFVASFIFLLWGPGMLNANIMTGSHVNANVWNSRLQFILWIKQTSRVFYGPHGRCHNAVFPYVTSHPPAALMWFHHDSSLTAAVLSALDQKNFLESFFRLADKKVEEASV